MFSKACNEPLSRQSRKMVNHCGILTASSSGSKNFLLAFESVSEPQVGPGVQRPRRTMRMMLAAVALLTLFACTRAARGQSSFHNPNVAVGSTSPVQTVSLTVTAGGMLSGIQVLTGGATGMDYAAAGTTCQTGVTYSVGQSCTVGLQFTAKFPGIRSGAVVLTDGSGNPMAMSFLTGIGLGPLSVATAGELTTIAGDGSRGAGSIPPSGSPALSAATTLPVGVAVDGGGNIYFTESGDDYIGKIDTSGNLTVIASGLDSPAAILVDGAGNVYFTEVGHSNNLVREVVAGTGAMRVVAGIGSPGFSNDGQAATSAALNAPQGLAMDASGNLYIADTGNNVIRVVNAGTGIIETVAGTPQVSGFAGDGGSALNAQFNEPLGLAFVTDGTPTGGTLYIADSVNNRIRKIDSSGNISTVAGSGNGAGYTGDSGPALSATLSLPAAVAVDAAGDLYISDENNNVIRKVNGGAPHVITTLAGAGASNWSGDGLNADTTAAALSRPTYVAIDATGNIFIADWTNLRVRKVYGALARIQFRDIKATNTSPPTIQRIDNDGNEPLHISSITPIAINGSVNSAVDPGTTTCSTSVALAPGAECNVGVEFKPMVVGSPVPGQINVASDSPSEPVVIDLFGNSLSINPTTTALTSSVNPSAVGQAVTFTATVSSLSPNVTGSVQFMDGSTVLAAVLLNNNTQRMAQFTTTSLALGTHVITAVYSGDTGDNANATSTSPQLLQVVKQTSVLVLSSGENPAKVYDAITFTVAVSETPAGGTAPTGSIVFSADGSQLPNPTIGISNGSASYTTTLLAAGSHRITASYAGDASDMAANSNVLTQVVNTATSTTVLSTSNASVSLTTPVMFTATVLGNNSSTPTGSVVFKDGTATIGTGTVNNQGVATLLISTLGTGSHSITAAYQGDQDYATSVSAALSETVNKIATSAAVVTSLNPAAAGAAVRFTVTVTAANSTTPNVAITGLVNLMEGSTVLGTGTLSPLGSGPATASAVISVSSLTMGSHAITAVYVGDTNYVGSTGAVSETISLATSSEVLTASTTAPIATKPVTLTATLTSNGGTPTGTVTFVDGPTPIGTGNVVNGIASITTSTLTVGPHTITAVYGGDAKDSPSTSNTVTVTVQAATTRVGLAPSQSPTNFGQPFTLTAAVSGNGGVPTGSVTFSDGGAALQTVTVVNGTATYTTSTLTDGSHTFTASYGGDANDLASNSAPLTVKVLQTLDIGLTSTSPNPSVARSNVHFIATITAKQGIQPTGSVTFFDGATALGTGAIVASSGGNTATFDTAALAVGTHAIAASYAGDGSTEAINSAPYSQVINAAGVTVTLASTANPAVFGTLLTFTATASSKAGALTGTVKFQDNGVTIGSAPLSSTGVATFSTSTLSTGVHPIVAAYQGDANDQPASSTTMQQVVERQTSVALTSSQNPLLTLAPVTMTAAVANGGGPTATGTITFAEDGVVLSTVPVSASGTATLQVASLPVGNHAFVATYSGDAVDLASASTPLSELVQLRGTTDQLTTSATSLTGGQQITLISVVRWSGPVTPTGTVTFYTGTYSLATVAVDSTGVATVTALLSGTSANLSSTYSGDQNYAPSTSGTELVTIGPAPDFQMTATPPVFALVSKQHLMVNLSIASLKNFTDTLSLGCLGLPQAATCSFSSDQMALTPGATQSVTLTVDTGNPLLAGSQAKNEDPMASKLVMACFLPGGLLLGLLGIRFRKVKGVGGLVVLLLLAGMTTVVVGCGTVNQIGTPAGVYHFNVSATGKTGVSETLPITMTVTE